MPKSKAIQQLYWDPVDPYFQRNNDARAFLDAQRGTAHFALSRIVEHIENALVVPSKNIGALEERVLNMSDKKLFDLWKISSPRTHTRNFLEQIAKRKHKENPLSLLAKLIDHKKFEEDPTGFIKDAIADPTTDFVSLEKTLRQMRSEQLLDLWKNAPPTGEGRATIERIADFWAKEYHIYRLRRDIDKIKTQEQPTS